MANEKLDLVFPVSDADLAAAFGGPAPLVNRLFVVPQNGAFFRMSFCEQNGDVVKTQFRAAVTMSLEDAISFRELLDSQVRASPLYEETLKNMPRVPRPPEQTN